MGDFAQTGRICTLQRLNETHLAAIEAELTDLSRTHPIALILPCHARDLAQPALLHLRTELQGAAWLSQTVVSVNGCDADMVQARRFFQDWPGPLRLLWNDEPAQAAAYTDLLGHSNSRGKGFNVWAAVGLLTATADVQTIVTEDCDVTTFQRADLARLCYATSHPGMGFALAKMYYSRATNRLYGRVSRLFLTPFLQALEHLLGRVPLLDFLLSFRYPLAGETAMRRQFAEEACFDAGWSLELATLCETHHRWPALEVCQVEGGPAYEHKHQPAPEALVAMARELASTLLAGLEAEGFRLDQAFYNALPEAFLKASTEVRRRYAALARINALPYLSDEEEGLTNAFAASLGQGTSIPSPMLPSWSSLGRLQPAKVAALFS